MKTAYITGCLGFIGSHLTRRCLDLGWEIYGVDSGTYAANMEYFDEFTKYENFHFSKIDINDIKDIKKCDYVINTAAESHVDNSINDSNAFINSNIIGVKNLLEIIRKKEKGERPLFFHFSTDEVYGDIEYGSHKETDILAPSNPYSASKAAADMLILAWSRTYKLNYIIIRPTNNYGFGQYPEKLIPSSIKRLSKKEKIQLHDNGTPIRTWLHVEDTVNAVLKILENNVFNEIYNVSGGFECNNFTVVNAIINKYFNNQIDNTEDFLDFSYKRMGQDIRYSLDDTKLKLLGWHTTKSFKEELEKIVDFEKLARIKN